MTFTVTPTGVSTPIEVYGTTQACSDYLLSSIGDGATAFAAADTNTREVLLVAATRYIERLAWRGAPTTPPVNNTTLSWPRTGITGVDPQTVPQALLNAVFELVGLIADDPGVQTAIDSGSNLQSLGAGSARLQFFRPTSADDRNATVLPQVVDQLVGQWLASADPSIAAAIAGVASGLDGHSDFGRCTCGCSPCCCGRKRNVSWPL
jgi:hypothetical protein